MPEADLLDAARRLKLQVIMRGGAFWIYLKAPVHEASWASWAARMKRQDART